MKTSLYIHTQNSGITCGAAGLDQKQVRSRAKTGIWAGIHTHTQGGGWRHSQTPEGAVSDTHRESYKNHRESSIESISGRRKVQGKASLIKQSISVIELGLIKRGCRYKLNACKGYLHAGS